MKAIVLIRGRIATVDDRDFKRVNQFKWFAHKKGQRYYAARNIRLPNGERETEYLHNFLMGVKGVDHKDGDGLENRRYNLRPASPLQNRRAFRRKASSATSQFRGVSWNSARGKGAAQIKAGPRQTYIGYFTTEEGAARAHDSHAIKLFGEFASIDFTRA